jgi:ribosome-binding protein aMBF1 (putative translation factor)
MTRFQAGKMIREKRLKMDIKLVDLAQVLGISPSCLSRIEGGEISPNKHLKLLNELLGLELRWVDTSKEKKLC